MNSSDSPLVRHVEAVHQKYSVVFGPDCHPFAQLFAAINYLEWWTRFCTASLLAAVEVNTPYQQNGDTARLLWTANNRQTFGDAFGLLRAVATFVCERRRELTIRAESQVILGLLDQLSNPLDMVKVRNELIGHGVYDLTGEEYRRAFSHLSGGVLRLLHKTAIRAAESLV